jgi:hypothetical protein
MTPETAGFVALGGGIENDADPHSAASIGKPVQKG